MEEQMIINGIEYIKKDSIFTIAEGDTIANSMRGEFVIVRSRNEGINAGTVEAADDTGIVLSGCRRIYYHRPQNRALSWYEGVAVSGLDDSSKVSGTVARKVIMEDYSITLCTDVAKSSILEHPPNAQN